MAWFENNNEASPGPAGRGPDGLCEPRCMDWPLCVADPCPIGPLADDTDGFPYATSEPCS